MCARAILRPGRFAVWINGFEGADRAASGVAPHAVLLRAAHRRSTIPVTRRSSTFARAAAVSMTSFSSSFFSSTPAAILVTRLMASTGSLRHRGHSHGVRAQHAERTDLRRSFVAGAHIAQIYSVAQCNALRGGHLVCQTAQSGRIGVGHIAEARAEARIVGAGERVGAHKIDVVVNDHQVAHLEAGVDAAGGIGHDQRCHAQLLHHPHGENDIGQCVAFVEMEAALHADDGFSAEAARHELALVARRGGADKVRNLTVGDDVLVGNHLGNAAQAGAQNQADAGGFPNACADILRRFLYVIAVHQMVPPYSSLMMRRAEVSALRIARSRSMVVYSPSR